MAFSIRTAESALILELSGSVTIRDAAELWGQLEPHIRQDPPAMATVTVETAGLSDIDTCILQLLCSLRKTAPRFVLAEPPPGVAAAIDRCGLRRELLAGAGAARETAG